MADFSTIKAEIDARITTNGNQEITGAILNGVLDDVVDGINEAIEPLENDGYLYAGVVNKDSSAPTATGKVFVIASTAGTYTNFDGIVVNEGEVAILKFDGEDWSKEVTGAASEEETIFTDIKDVTSSYSAEKTLFYNRVGAGYVWVNDYSHYWRLYKVPPKCVLDFNTARTASYIIAFLLDSIEDFAIGGSILSKLTTSDTTGLHYSYTNESESDMYVAVHYKYGSTYHFEDVRLTEFTSVKEKISNIEPKLSIVASGDIRSEATKPMFYNYLGSGSYVWKINYDYYWRVFKIEPNEELVATKLANRSDVIMGFYIASLSNFNIGGSIGNVAISANAPIGDYFFKNESDSDIYIALLWLYNGVNYFSVSLRSFVNNVDTTLLKAKARGTITIYASDNEQSVLEKMKYAYFKGNVDVYFERATYILSDITYSDNSLMGAHHHGLPIGGNCRYYLNGSTIISEEPTEITFTESRHTLDVGLIAGDLEMHDGVIINNGGYYCIHDDYGETKTPYTHKYINITMMYNYNAETSAEGCKQFGCGTGSITEILFDGCLFLGSTRDNVFLAHGPSRVRYDVPAINKFTFIDSYFANTIGISMSQFEPRDTLEIIMHGNSYTQTPAIGELFEVISYNNEVRQ